MKSLIHCCLASENFILNPRSSEAAAMTHALASLAHLLTRILDRCRPWPLCLKVFLMSSAEKPWFRIMCVLSLSWNRECCITSVAYVIVCVMAWYDARIDGFLITGFGIMWWGVASEDTHNPHKRDPRGPQAPRPPGTNKYARINTNFIFCFSKKKIAMMDEAKAIVKRTMCNQNPLCCNVWSLLGHLIYWLNLFSFDYLWRK